MSQAQDVAQFMGEHGQQINSPQNFWIGGLELHIVRGSGVNEPAIARGIAIQSNRATDDLPQEIAFQIDDFDMHIGQGFGTSTGKTRAELLPGLPSP